MLGRHSCRVYLVGDALRVLECKDSSLLLLRRLEVHWSLEEENVGLGLVNLVVLPTKTL